MNPNDLMTTAEVADCLKFRPNALEHWRTRSLGPRYEYAGRRVIYRRKDVDDWLRINRPRSRCHQA